MAFKMKGFPLQAGTSPAKKYASDAQRKAIYASKAERSAAKQRSADQKTLEELIEEGFTPADARRMQKDKAVTGVETDKKKMQRLEDEAAKANKAGNKEKAKKLIAQVSKLEDKIQGKKDRPEPTYEGTDEFRKEKDIPKKEFKKRGVKKPPTKQRGRIIEPFKSEPIPTITRRMPSRVMPEIKEINMGETLLRPEVLNPRGPGKIGGPDRRSKVGKKLTKAANILRKKKNKRSPDFK